MPIQTYPLAFARLCPVTEDPESTRAGGEDTHAPPPLQVIHCHAMDFV